MPCYAPMQAIRTGLLTKLGKSVIAFIARKDHDKHKSNPNLIKGLPCGRCIGCRLERSRQWAVRIEKEILTTEQSGKQSYFITLTFDDEHLHSRPNPYSLDKRDFQLFMKRLRKSFGGGIRYFHCGEYGERYQRPHYHAIIFGIHFDDLQFYKNSNGHMLYTSPTLSRIWGQGFASVGSATFESAAYVARYILKKKFGTDSWLHYIDFDKETGEIHRQRIPEYTTMSRRKGIGKDWFDKYLVDVYPRDRIFIRDSKHFARPPKYYDSLYELHSPDEFKLLKDKRTLMSISSESDNTPDRLHVKEQVILSRIKHLKRNLE